MKKSILSGLILALTGTFTNAAPFETYQNPGMALRLEQNTISSWKKAMEEFLPHYINNDLDLPQEYSYDFAILFGILKWQVEWYDIQYDLGQFDIRDCEFLLAKQFELPMLKIRFPALKEWKIHAMQKTNSWLLPQESKVELEFHDFQFDISCELRVTDQGYLRPDTYASNIRFGKSYLYHDNQWVAVAMHQIVQFVLIIVENSVFWVGDYIFTNMSGPVIANFLDGYQFQLKGIGSPFHGQGTSDDFALDYRQTQDPFLGDGWMDTYFVGALTYHGNACELEHDYFDFMDAQEFSQVVITESAATCALNNIASSKIGKLEFNEKKANQFFGVDNIKFDTSAFAQHIPIFKEKIGPNKPLNMKLSFKNFEVLFGQYDSDIILNYKACVTYSVDDLEVQGLKKQELLYDEIEMTTAMNMKAENDILFMDILSHKLNISNKFGQKVSPMRNNMKLTANEYREFLSTFGFSNNYLKKWMNDVVFRNGVKFPYNMKEIYTSVQFQEKSAHIFLEVEEEMGKLLEKDLWKK